MENMKHMGKYSIIYWNNTQSCPYIYPYYQIIIMTVIDIHNMIGWFTRRNQN